MKELALKIGNEVIKTPLGIKDPQGAGLYYTQDIIRTVITFILVVSTILGLIFLIYGGIKWITSGGDKAGVEAARKTVTYAVVGLSIVFAAFLILRTITGIFGINYFGPTGPICGQPAYGVCTVPDKPYCIETPSGYVCDSEPL